MVAAIWWIAAYKLYFRKRHSWGVALIFSVLSWYALMLIIAIAVAGLAVVGPLLGG